MSQIERLLVIEQRHERMLAELRALLHAMEFEMVDPMVHSRRLREILGDK